MKPGTYYCVLLIMLTVMAACNKDDLQRHQPFELTAPANFPAIPEFPDNPLSEAGVELGRRLFYDTRLSGNNMISCASCHHPALAFSDAETFASNGVSGTALHRHTPALINMAWVNNGLFWDGGSTNLESQAFGPLTAKDEMHQNLAELVSELNAVPDYVTRFRKVFNDDIRSAYIVRALAQFQRTMISGNSRYDRFIRNEAGASLSASEISGMNIVRQKCQGCHAGELFTDNNYHNNGIDADFSNDQLEGLYQGRFRITYLPSDLGKFKTPTLRNVMITAPYMHDGRFSTIDAVLNHYQSQVQASATLDEKMKQNAGQAGIPLTAEEKKSVIDFLKTLTDTSFLQNKKLANPF